jgi:hypothetical protein
MQVFQVESKPSMLKDILAVSTNLMYLNLLSLSPKLLLETYIVYTQTKDIQCCEPGLSEIFTLNKLVIMLKQTQNKFRSDELAKVLEISIYARCFYQSSTQRQHVLFFFCLEITDKLVAFRKKKVIETEAKGLDKNNTSMIKLQMHPS